MRTGGEKQEGPRGREFPLHCKYTEPEVIRRLAARTYETKCQGCIWGCHMAVDMILDQWNPHVRRYRTETFCYGRCRVRSTSRVLRERSRAAEG